MPDYETTGMEEAAGLDDDVDDYLVVPKDKIVYTNNTRVEVSLLQLCKDMEAPLWGFEQIMNWAHDAWQSGYQFMPKQATYDSQIRKLQSWLDMDHMRPIVKTVELPGPQEEKHTINVTMFNFKSQVHSLLSDPLLNVMNNLVVNREDVFAQYSPPDGKLGECLSGSWYQTAYQHMLDQKLGNFLCPIILYMDKAQLSMSSSSLSLFPVQMSLGIFTEEVRRHSYAWRPLGYIANEAIFFSKDQRKENKPNTINARTHTILAAILDSMFEAQKPRALQNIQLQLGPHVRRVDMYMPLQFIIGDVEGGDLLCSRFYYRREKCQRLCRTCDVPMLEATRTDIDCNRVTVAHILQMIENEEFEELRRWAHRPTYNCLYKVDCGNDPYGVMSMIHTEGLHAFEIGVVPYMLEILVTEIPNRFLGDLDRLVQRLVHLPRMHGYENFPRLIWPDGVTSLTQLTGSEKVGKMFAITLAASTLEGEQFFSKVLDGGADTWRKMLYCFQQILCYWAWLKQDTYWMAGDEAACLAATNSIKKMIEQIKVLWPRKKGLKWNITKLHEQLHIPRDIMRQGRHSNVHTGPQENNHIPMKHAAQQTQRRKKLIDLQTGERVIDRLNIQRAYDWVTGDYHVSPTDADPPTRISPVASKGYMRLERSTGQSRGVLSGGVFWDSKKYNAFPLRHDNYIFALLAQIYFEDNHSVVHNAGGSTAQQLDILFFTEYQRQGVTYRFHPSFRSEYAHYDWAYIRWWKSDDPITGEPVYEELPAQILFFFIDPVDGEYKVVVHSVQANTASQHGVYGTYWHTEFHGNDNNHCPKLFAVSVDTLERHAMMIPYVETDDFKWIEIWDQSTWSDCFQTIEAPTE